jgi:hypothetical protein
MDAWAAAGKGLGLFPAVAKDARFRVPDCKKRRKRQRHIPLIPKNCDHRSYQNNKSIETPPQHFTKFTPAPVLWFILVVRPIQNINSRRRWIHVLELVESTATIMHGGGPRTRHDGSSRTTNHCTVAVVGSGRQHAVPARPYLACFSLDRRRARFKPKQSFRRCTAASTGPAHAMRALYLASYKLLRSFLLGA